MTNSDSQHWLAGDNSLTQNTGTIHQGGHQMSPGWSAVPSTLMMEGARVWHGNDDYCKYKQDGTVEAPTFVF